MATAPAQSALGAGSLRWVSDVIGALCEANAAAGLDAINQAVDSGADARQFARQIVEHLRAVMLIKLGDPALVDLPAEQRAAFNAQAERLELDRLTRAIKLFNQAALDLRGGWQPQLPLELALVEALQQTAVPIAVAPAAPVVRRPASAAAPAPVQAAPEPDPVKPAPDPKPAPSKVTAQAAPSPTGHEPASAFTVEEVVAAWNGILSSIKSRSIPAKALLRIATCPASSTTPLS